MDRRKRLIQKRKAKQRKADAGKPLSRGGYWGADTGPEPGSKLIFKKGTAAVASAWQPGSPHDPPAAPEEQP